MGHYPGSIDSPNKATIYGPLPTHGFTAAALVLHTTETAGMPGFDHGNTAPHYVYAPRTRLWTMWAEYEDGYVGTLKGHSTAGHGNCKAFQVEILAYSGHGSPNVDAFTGDNYADLAEFYAWARDRYGIGNAVYPAPEGGWKYGTSSPYRMSTPQWEAFSGLTAHGGVPLNTHWDTGVLDLQRIHDLSQPEEDPMYLPLRIGTDRKDDVKWLQRALNRADADPVLEVNGIYDDLVAQAIEDMGIGDGDRLGSKAYDRLLNRAYGK